MRFAASITNRRQAGFALSRFAAKFIQPTSCFHFIFHLQAPPTLLLLPPPSATPQTPQLTFKLFAFGAADCLAVFAFCGYGYPTAAAAEYPANWQPYPHATPPNIRHSSPPTNPNVQLHLPSSTNRLLLPGILFVNRNNWKTGSQFAEFYNYIFFLDRIGSVWKQRIYSIFSFSGQTWAPKQVQCMLNKTEIYIQLKFMFRKV